MRILGRLNNMKRLLVLLVVFTLVLAAGAQAIELDDCRVTWCEEYVTLRAYPSTSAKALIRVPLGATVTNVSCDSYSDRFYCCTYKGHTGYILSEYLLGGQEMADIEGAYVAHCEAWVSLRARPSTSSERLMKVPKGQHVQDAYYVENGFVHCVYHGVEGYILSQYIEGSY